MYSMSKTNILLLQGKQTYENEAKRKPFSKTTLETHYTPIMEGLPLFISKILEQDSIFNFNIDIKPVQ